MAAPQSQVHLIRIQLRSISQLFNSLDPSPFEGRDLDADAEAFITDWASESPPTAAFCLELSLSHALDEHEQARVKTAVQGYFNERVSACNRELRQLMKDGRLSLVIGLVFLGTCLFTSRLIEARAMGMLLSESLLIGGWVAMWRPMEIFLYRWWPIVRKRGLYRRLSVMEVRFLCET